ncbi:MAG TPA: DUF6516 family protein [archaeon]|nr:DUF6516 family protein [archaeon]
MAGLILKERKQLGEDSFVEFKIYEIPKSPHFPDRVKYSMSFVRNGTCVLRYDNERGKGHHKHFKEKESKVEFSSIGNLMKQFLVEVKNLREAEK